MAQTPEGRVKSRVTRLLKKYGAYYHMPVQSGFGAPALDYHVCYKGHYVGIETKAPGNHHPTKRQQTIIDQIREAGGTVFIINGTEGLMELEEWLVTTL